MPDAVKPVVLIIRDGWGANHNNAHDAYNAVKLAKTPCADQLSAQWPRTELVAHGPEVGLPEGIMGNSEVGHQNIGAGRVVDQEIVRINKGIESGAVKDVEALQQAITVAKNGGKLHLMGLVSDAGVHAMLDHLYGLLKVIKGEGIDTVYVHAFTDGRDTGPFTGKDFIAAAEAEMAKIGCGTFASVCGRYWAMDRDKRWDRVQRAYNCLTARKIEKTASSATGAVQSYYDQPETDNLKGDEFVSPTVIVGEGGKPVGPITSGDAVIFFNFRGDRPREITAAFINQDFDGFDRGEQLDLFYATMTEYQKGLCEHILFRKPPKMPDILGQVVADRCLKQFRCAETEKFPHVTFFFNDYREEPFEGEDRSLVDSPKDVSTYDQKPEMSAYGVRDQALGAIRSGQYALVVVNFANPDMVGHTGVLEACIKACEVVDGCVQELLEAVDAACGAHTSHTLNPVEAVIYGSGCEGLKLSSGGCLGDIAPTLLHLMGIEKPTAMTGKNLIQTDA